MNTYQIFLHAHSGLRWLVLVAAVIVIIKSMLGVFGKPVYQKVDNILAASFVGTMHLQLLIGLILYFFLSPFTDQAFSDFGAAMKDAVLRFWAVEHLILMVLAVAAAQVGRSLSRKKEDPILKYRYQAIFFGISLMLMVLGIPWNRF